jgi:predicted ATPase/DNA-binding SARP family transcriptional activator
VLVTTLGPLAVDGRPVRGDRLAAAVRELVGARGRAVSTAALTSAVWTDAPPEDAAGALHAIVARVRRLGLPVVGVPGGYRVAADQVVVDAVEATSLVRQAQLALRDRQAALAGRLADQARAYFPEVPELAEPGSARLFAEIAMVRAESALAGAGRVDEADLRRLVTQAPPDEPAVALLVRVLAAAGREAEALELVERVRAELSERYGADPSPVVVRAQLALLRGELGTDPEPRMDLPGPPRSAAAVLPAGWRRPATPLVGRERDVLALTGALAGAPLATIVATGGAGKTRLAAEVARRGVADGSAVRVVELAGLRTPDEVLPALLGAIGGAEPTPRADLGADRRVLSPLDRLRLAARELTGLVVLDNCEHLLAATAAVVADLLAATPPEFAVLATSRAPLGLVGEFVYRLEALSDEDAVRLIGERGRAGGAVATWPTDRLLELCHRLDNLPLALELAAARLRQLPIEDLLAGLADRFALLDDALRGLPERHASLWALVDWSRELLDPADRELLQRLAVIPAPFTAATAAAVAGASLTDAGTSAVGVPRGLGNLVEQSLLTFDEGDGGPPRYRMLETVREYGEARLDASGDRDVAMAGLVGWARDHAVALAADFVGPRQVEALARCAADQENLLAALRWAVNHDDERAAVDIAASLFRLWTVRGLHLEVLEWGRVLLRVDGPAGRPSAIRHGTAAGRPLPDADRLVWACLFIALNSGLIGQGPTRVHVLARRAIRLVFAQRPEQISTRAAALALAVPVLDSPDLEVSLGAAADLVAHPDPYVQGFGFFARAVVYENAGRLELSAEAAEQAYHQFEAAGDHWLMGMAAQGLAQTLTARGVAGGDGWLRRGARHLELVGAAEDARSVQVLLDIQLALASDPEALRRLEDTSMSDEADAAQARLGLAQVAWCEGRYHDVVTHTTALARIVTHAAVPIPQQRSVFRVATAILQLRAAQALPDADADGELARRAATLLVSAGDDAVGGGDGPVLGSWAMGGAELSAYRGGVDRARELFTLGLRLGAHVGFLFYGSYSGPLTTEFVAGERPAALLAAWRERPVAEASSRIEELMRELLDPPALAQTLRR